jgi:hypothetical protein
VPNQHSTIQNWEDAPPCSTCGADRDPQRRLLQVLELQEHVRELCVGTQGLEIKEKELAGAGGNARPHLQGSYRSLR